MSGSKSTGTADSELMRHIGIHATRATALVRDLVARTKSQDAA